MDAEDTFVKEHATPEQCIRWMRNFYDASQHGSFTAHFDIGKNNAFSDTADCLETIQRQLSDALAANALLIAENRKLRERVADLEDGVRAQFAKVDALIAENRRLREALESIRDSDSFRGGTWKGELQRIAKDELKHGSQS